MWLGELINIERLALYPIITFSRQNAAEASPIWILHAEAMKGEATATVREASNM